MTRTEITEQLKKIMIGADGRNREKYEAAQETANLTTDLGFTSVNILYMVIVIEKVFSVRFENVNIADFQTLGDVVDYIEKAQK
ncbi:MAG: acyl carrier protein [Clostridia bacterium]|nr:acyl carrier protein [Clostridia bacterium]